jgi:hypothetical protein
MNAFQLLEVATKVFVNWDQEAQKEAEQKMKKKNSMQQHWENEEGTIPVEVKAKEEAKGDPQEIPHKIPPNDQSP